MKKKDFCVLLAAYNGEKFLKKQLYSILNQININLDILISLDKSSDNSIRLIKTFQKKYNNIYLISSNKIFGNASSNFLHLIKSINFNNYNYVSFSDQDDIWLTNKLNSAKKKIIKFNLDGYASNTLSYTERKKIKIIKSQKFTEFDFLFEGGGPGHTIVITNKIAKKIQKRLKSHKFKNIKINYYDWFIYFFVRAYNGKWFIDDKYFVLYRQHSLNEIGSNLGFKGIKRRFDILVKNNLIDESKKYAKITGIYNKKQFNIVYKKNIKTLIFVIINFYKFRRKKTEKIIFLFAFLFLYFRYFFH